MDCFVVLAHLITPFTPFCLRGFPWYIVIKTSARESAI